MGPELGYVLAAAIAFHVAVYGWNDIADLELDRTQSRRAKSPLVQGKVRSIAIARLATGAGCVALAIAALSGVPAGCSMAIALILLLVYDFYGKRTTLPPALDALQGIGWAALLVFSAFTVASPTAATAWMAAYAVFAIALINGVHGGIRDLPNDFRHQVRTTAVMLGAVPVDGDGVLVPALFVSYALAVNLATIAILAAGIQAQNAAASSIRMAIAGLGGAVGFGLLAALLVQAPKGPRSWPFGLAHIVLVLTLPLLLVPGSIEPSFAFVLIVLFGLPTSAAIVAMCRLRKTP